MPEIKRVHHIAVLVEDIEAALKFWHESLGLKPSTISEKSAEAARVAFLPVGESEIELVQPTTSDSGISRYLEKHGAGMHHLCLEVDDIQAIMQRLEASGIQLINEQPKMDEDGRLYAFIHPKSSNGVLVELYQVPK